MQFRSTLLLHFASFFAVLMKHTLQGKSKELLGLLLSDKYVIVQANSHSVIFPSLIPSLFLQCTVYWATNNNTLCPFVTLWIRSYCVWGTLINIATDWQTYYSIHVVSGPLLPGSSKIGHSLNKAYNHTCMITRGMQCIFDGTSKQQFNISHVFFTFLEYRGHWGSLL